MKKLFSTQYLFVLAVLVWIMVVLVYFIPLDDGRKNRGAGFIFLVGLLVLFLLRTLWRWLMGHKNPWGE